MSPNCQLTRWFIGNLHIQLQATCIVRAVLIAFCFLAYQLLLSSPPVIHPSTRPTACNFQALLIEGQLKYSKCEIKPDRVNAIDSQLPSSSERPYYYCGKIIRWSNITDKTIHVYCANSCVESWEEAKAATPYELALRGPIIHLFDDLSERVRLSVVRWDDHSVAAIDGFAILFIKKLSIGAVYCLIRLIAHSWTRGEAGRDRH